MKAWLQSFLFSNKHAANDAAVISRAYKKREKEIESLRQHDLGNKVINAPDLKKAVRSVQKTS